MAVHRSFVVPLACAALLAIVPASRAIARDVDEEAAHSRTTLQLYGSWTPGIGGSTAQSGTSWGFGAAIHWIVSGRWSVGFDAARFDFDRTTVTPLIAGITYGTGKSKGVQPYAEVGGGYYQLTRPVERLVAFGASGNVRDQFAVERASTYSHDAVGAYFGAGLGVGLTPRLGLDVGARAHNWVDLDLNQRKWDGMISLRSGLSYHF